MSKQCVSCRLRLKKVYTVVQTFCQFTGGRNYTSSSKMQNIRYALQFLLSKRNKLGKGKLIAPGRLYFKYMLMGRGNVILIAGNKCPLADRQVFSNVLIFVPPISPPFCSRSGYFFLTSDMGLISTADSRHL